MIRDIHVPKWGLTIEQITVDKWLVGVGDQVSTGQPICEVLTDKASSEIESPADGTILELIAAVGSDCAVGDVVARIQTV